ncbi:hypothetical protein AB0L10_42165 [Streptomyces flaveolus]|uniref:hypothetical protein n=1 Tax=Streptomyces flaveolus TaxID=67297 RepID=UPI0034429830
MPYVVGWDVKPTTDPSWVEALAEQARAVSGTLPPLVFRRRLMIVARTLASSGLTSSSRSSLLALEGLGYGFLIPVFFVTSGIQFNSVPCSPIVAGDSCRLRRYR